MKRPISMLLMLCLLLIPMAGKASADDHELLPVTAAEAQPLDHVSVDESVEFEPGSVPAVSAPLDAISLPIHALVLSMLEQDLRYDAQSDRFIWNALYYALSLYGDLDDRVESTNGSLLLPSESVQDYLSALFSAPHELPDVPAPLSDCVSYDQTSDHYLLIPGHFKASELRLDPSVWSEHGTHTLSGVLFASEVNSVLCTFWVTLVQNDGMFGFSVRNLTIM